MASSSKLVKTEPNMIKNMFLLLKNFKINKIMEAPVRKFRTKYEWICELTS